MMPDKGNGMVTWNFVSLSVQRDTLNGVDGARVTALSSDGPHYAQATIERAYHKLSLKVSGLGNDTWGALVINGTAVRWFHCFADGRVRVYEQDIERECDGWGLVEYRWGGEAGTLMSVHVCAEHGRLDGAKAGAGFFVRDFEYETSPSWPYIQTQVAG